MALEDKPGEYNLVYPFLQHRNLKDKIDDLECFLKYVFEELLNLETTILELLIINNMSYGSDFRIKLMEMLFEGLRVLSVNFIPSSIASLFISGRTTGINFEIGNMSTNIVPIFEGLILNHALYTDSFGGNNATKIIRDFL